MAQLKDTVIQGSARVTDTLYANTVQLTALYAPTTTNGTTYGAGSNNQVLRSNGTSVYWATLGGAAGYGVTDSTSASAIGTSANLVTERDIYYGLPTLNNAHNYTSSTTLYAPTSAGTANQILISSGGTAAPVWSTTSNKAVTLAWATTHTIATIGGVNLTLTMPGNPNTNTTYSFVNGNPTLAWNTTSTVGTAGGVAFTVKMPANPDSHLTTHMYVNATAGGATSNAATANTNTYLHLYDNTTKRETIQLTGATNVSVTATTAGVVTITGPAVSNTAPTLSWGNTSTVGTVGGTALTVKMPANPDTNTTYSFSNSGPTLSWGNTSTIGTAGGTTYTVKMPANPDSHYITHMYLNATAAGATSNAATTNTSTYLHIYDNTTKRETIQIKGAGATSVTATTAGVMTITSTNTTYSFTNSGPTLSWGNTSTIGTVGGVALTVKMPANPDTNTTYSFSNNAPTLSWGNTSTVGTVGGVALTVKMPANPDTNTTYAFSNSGPTLSWGNTSTIGTAGGTTYTVKMPANPDSHWTSHMYVNATAGGATSNAATANTSTYLHLYDNTTKRETIQLTGATNVSVTATTAGVVTITGPSVSNTGPTLSWGNTSTIGTIGGTALTVKMPSNPDTNTTYSFSNSGPTLSWGNTSTIGTAGGTTYTVKMPANPDSHYISHMYVNATAAGATSNAATTNTSTYLHLYDTSTKRETIQLKGSGATSVTATTAGVITISSTNTTYAFSNSGPTLAWDTTSTIGTVGGTALTVKMPANPNTNTTYSFSNNGPTLAWNTTSTIGTVGGVALTVKMPANPDTNTTYSFSNSGPTLSWGNTSTIGTAGGTTYTVKMPSNPNTNQTTHIYVNATAAGATSNAATTNTSTYLHLYDNSTKRETIQLKGAGATTVTAASNGVITITSTDNNTWRPIGTGATDAAAGNHTHAYAASNHTHAYAASSHTHSYAGSASAGGAATSLVNFVVSTTSNLGIDAPSTNAIGYVSGLTKAAWNYQQTDGALYAQWYNASWIGEIFQDYRTGQISVRGKNNGTWQSWRRILDETNGATILGLGTAATQNSTAFAAASHTHAYAATSHGNHVPATQTANNAIFLRNDNTWQTVTPANIGAAAASHTHAYAATSHGNHVPATQTANNAVFLRNDNTWQTVTPANIGAAASSHTHDYAASSHTHAYAASSHTHAYAAVSHGNHVPTTQTANNAVFLRNDNTWQTVTPANIGAAAASHTHAYAASSHTHAYVATTATIAIDHGGTGATTAANARTNLGLGSAATQNSTAFAAASHGLHVPATQTASNSVFLRNDNTWQTVTPANIGAAAASHTHAYAASSHTHAYVSTSATIDTAHGGTNTTIAPTAGGVIYGASSSAYGCSAAAGGSGRLLVSNNTNVAPEWTTYLYYGKVISTSSEQEILTLGSSNSVRLDSVEHPDGTDNGRGLLMLGNNIANGSARASHGEIYLYTYGSGAHVLKAHTTETGSTSYSHYLPLNDGTLVTTNNTTGSNAKAGSATKPVYVAANGVITECTDLSALLKTVQYSYTISSIAAGTATSVSASNFNTSTPSGYTLVGLVEASCSNTSVGIHYFAPKRASAGTLRVRNYSSSAVTNCTVYCTLLYAKSSFYSHS